MKNKKSLIALLLIAVVGMIGLTIAYFTNNTDIENLFTTKEYGTEYTETFVSPDNWLPGDTTEKTLEVENTGEVGQAVRVLVEESWTTHNNGTLNGWIHTDGTKSTHTTGSELETDERVVILNLANIDDWTKVGNYYYYNYQLPSGEVTSSFLESVTFNSKTKLDDSCTEIVNNGIRTIECNSSGDNYDDATYTLSLTVETVQYNKYASAWNTGNTINILEEKPNPGSMNLVNNNTNPVDAAYNDSTKCNMFEFEHSQTVQTPALTDYRYIGDAPCNYVKFNCDNDGTNCETWRIVGVFSVERPDPEDNTQTITEQRIKLVRGSSFASSMSYDSSNSNNWTSSSIKSFLNGDYYNRSGDAATYGLKESARNMIDDAKYYLGGRKWVRNVYYGSTEEIYNWERGTTVSGGKPTKWIGKVAIMYPSDDYMVYGKGVNATCYNNPYNCGGSIATLGWIYNSNILEGQSASSSIWFLSPVHDSDYQGFWIRFGAGDNGSLNSTATNNSSGVRPVVYLKADVKIVDGIGTSDSPYVLR